MYVDSSLDFLWMCCGYWARRPSNLEAFCKRPRGGRSAFYYEGENVSGFYGEPKYSIYFWRLVSAGFLECLVFPVLCLLLLWLSTVKVEPPAQTVPESQFCPGNRNFYLKIRHLKVSGKVWQIILLTKNSVPQPIFLRSETHRKTHLFGGQLIRNSPRPPCVPTMVCASPRQELSHTQTSLSGAGCFWHASCNRGFSGLIRFPARNHSWVRVVFW